MPLYPTTHKDPLGISIPGLMHLGSLHHIENLETCLRH